MKTPINCWAAWLEGYDGVELYATRPRVVAAAGIISPGKNFDMLGWIELAEWTKAFGKPKVGAFKVSLAIARRK